MTKLATVQAQVEPELKVEEEAIFRQLGLSITEAVTLFYQQVKLNQGLPFEVRVPNITTLQTFQDTDAGLHVVPCADAQDLFDQLGI